MKNQPSRGLPPPIVVPVVFCIAIVAAIPIVSFLKTGFATSGSSISNAEIATPPPAVSEALAELRARIARNPHDVEALSSLAGLYAQIGRTQTAAQLEEQAVEAAPNDVSLRAADVALLQSAGKRAAARAQLDAIVRLAPTDADAYYARGELELESHERAAAQRDMRKFLLYADKGDTRRPAAKATLAGGV